MRPPRQATPAQIYFPEGTLIFRFRPGIVSIRECEDLGGGAAVPVGLIELGHSALTNEIDFDRRIFRREAGCERPHDFRGFVKLFPAARS